MKFDLTRNRHRHGCTDIETMLHLAAASVTVFFAILPAPSVGVEIALSGKRDRDRTSQIVVPLS